MQSLEPFQFLYVAAASAWTLAQVLPKTPIQDKIQGTAGLILIMLGLSMTGLITIPQYGPDETKATPVAMYDGKIDGPEPIDLNHRKDTAQAIKLRDDVMRELAR